MKLTMIIEAIDLGALKTELAIFLRTSGKISGIDGAGHTLLRYDKFFEYKARNKRADFEDTDTAAEDIDTAAEENKVDAADLILDRLMSIDPSPKKGFMRWLVKMFDAGYISFDDGPFTGINRFDNGLNIKTQLHLPEDYGDLTRGIRELGKTGKDKALYAELGLSTDIQHYPDVASVIAVPRALAGTRGSVWNEGENMPPWIKVIEKQLGCVKVLDKGGYIIVMTPKDSLASKYGFSSEVRLKEPLPPKGLGTGQNIRRFQPGCTYDAIGVLGGFGEESAWCTRYGREGGSIPDNYLPFATIYTVFKQKGGYPAQYMQMCFGDKVQLMNDRNQPVKQENIEEPLREYLVQVMSSSIEPLPKDFKGLSYQEKDEFNQKNRQFKMGFMMMLTPEYLMKNPTVNAIYVALMGPGRANMKILRDLLETQYLKAIKQEISIILSESGIDPRANDSLNQFCKATLGTPIENLLSVFLKNPNILAVNDLKPSPDAKDPFLLPPEMMFYVYDRNPFQLSTQKRDAYLGDLLDHIATLKIKTIINTDPFYKPYIDILLNHPDKALGTNYKADIKMQAEEPKVKPQQRL